MNPTTLRVLCPCGSNESVVARHDGFSATSMQATACRQCQARGMVAYKVRTSWVSFAPTTTVAHRDGLVSFA